MKTTSKVLAFVCAVIALGCGGGGGGGSTAKDVTISGAVFNIENMAPTNPASSVTISSKSTTTDLTTGVFSIAVPSGAKTANVTFVPAGGTPQVFDYTFPTVTADQEIGDLYVGVSKVSVRGRLVNSANATPIAGGSVAFAGRTATSASDGTFSLNSVAYPAANFAGFFSLVGSASATNFFNGSFQASTTAVGSVVSVGDVPLVPSGSDSPPALPANAILTVGPVQSGVVIIVNKGSSIITTGTTNTDGQLRLWLPIGTYTIAASKGTLNGNANLTITNLTTPVSQTITLG